MEQQTETPTQSETVETAEHSGFFSRLGEWFKGSGANDAAADPTTEARMEELAEQIPLQGQLHDAPVTDQTHPGGSPVAIRSTLFRPWAKRDAAIENLQQGFGALSDLMLSIRDNLDRSNDRQDQLLKYLSCLPEVLQQLPENARTQTEALKAIQRRFDLQSDEQAKLADILDRMSRADQANGRTLDALSDRVGAISEHDGRIAENLSGVGSALESVSRNGEATGAVLLQLRETQATRGDQIERLLAKQSTRFSTLLVISILMSVAAISSVATVAYLLMTSGAVPR
jgi:hypothetical protein